MEILKECIVLGCLSVLAWMDIKKMEISVPLVAMLGTVGIIFQFWTDLLTWRSVLGGTLVGGAMLLIAAASRESIGVGDGLLFCATGVCLGWWENVRLLLLASFGAAATAIILILIKKYTRKSRIPFVPFVLMADILGAFMR